MQAHTISYGQGSVTQKVYSESRRQNLFHHYTLDTWVTCLFLQGSAPKEPYPRISATLCLSSASITKYHKLSGLSTTKIYFSQFQRMELWDYDANTVRFWWKPSSGLQPADLSLYPLTRQKKERASSLASS